MYEIKDPELKNFLQDPFVTLSTLDGTVYRSQPGRKTIAFNLNTQTYFAKIHTGVGWKEIIKNILQLRLPVISAKTEWNALLALKKLNILAPTPVAFGEKGIDPSRLQSFIITKSLPESINLEDFLKQNGSITFTLKNKLIETVARIAKQLHENGINHRDFYLCHFLLDQNKSSSDLYIIDLHRAQIRRKTPLRWKIKDLSGLYFSTMNFNFTQRDYLRFIRIYTNKTLRESLRKDHLFWKIISIKAKRLYQKCR